MAAIDGIKIVAGKSTFPEANQYEPFIYTLD